jgi:hypothetical protein
VTDITLEALRLRERELELDAVLIRGRVLEIRNMIQELERRRGGRPRRTAEVAVIPQRVAGGVFQDQQPNTANVEPEDAAQ